MSDVKSIRKSETVLVVAAHPDDEVLGCGGTIARMANEGRAVHILLMADGETSRVAAPERLNMSDRMTARRAAAEAASTIMGCVSVEVLALPDNRLDGLELLEVIKLVEACVQRHQPVTVFTHHAGDVNVDHRVVHEAVVAACRPQPDHPVKELLFFEVPSSTEWRPPSSALAFHPNYFVDISRTLSAKHLALQVYSSEVREFPHPRSTRAIEALARWRGASVGVEAAEAFILGRKLVSGPCTDKDS